MLMGYCWVWILTEVIGNILEAYSLFVAYSVFKLLYEILH